MGGRSRLRWLMDALETRYELLSDDTPSMTVGVHQIRADVTDYVFELDRCESQVQTLEELLSTLREETVELRRRKNWTQLAVTTPVEILRRIFKMTCSPATNALHILAPEENDDFVSMARGLRQTRQTISSVCSRWKEVVLQDSALWDDVAVEYANGRGLPSCGQFVSETALAGNRELSIYLAMDCGSKDAIAPIFKHLKDTLSCRTISLNMSTICSTTVASPVFADLRAFTKLRTIRFGLDFEKKISYSVDPWTDDLALAVDLSGMQYLREVVIDCVDTHGALSEAAHIVPPQTCGITHLVLRCPYKSEFENVLEASACINLINSCQHLEKLDWCMGTTTVTTVPPGCRLDIQSQNHLTELSIAGEVPFSLLPTMHYPNLLTLRIHDHPDYNEAIQTHQTQSYIHGLFATTKFPKLRHFDQRLCEHSEHVVPFLHMHPGLEELVLWCDIDAALAEGLTSLSESAPRTFRLPNLTRVWTNQCHECTFGPGECMHPSAPHTEEILWRRALHQSTSRPFELYLHPNFHGPDVSHLAAIYNEHVTVREGTYQNTTWYRYDYR